MLTPFMNRKLFIQAMQQVTQTDFDMKEIKKNIEKYSYEHIIKKYKLIIKNV